MLVCGIIRGCVLLLMSLYLSRVSGGCAIEPDENGHVDIPSTWTQVDAGAFSGCLSLRSVNISAGVTGIGAWAFHRCYSLKSVIIGDNVTSIGEDAFSFDGALENVIIGNNVSHINRAAFLLCSSLESVIIPDSVESIGDWAFHKSGLKNMVIGENVTSIGEDAFSGCVNLKSVTISDSVRDIDKSAFASSGLESVTIPDGLTRIENSAFFGCERLRSVTIGKNVASIGEKAFYKCMMLTTITIPDSVIRIGDRAFAINIHLSNVVFGRGLIEIGIEAFWGCVLTSIVIPPNVQYIKGSAFGFNGLKSIEIGPSPSLVLGSSVFAGNPDIFNVTILSLEASMGSGIFSREAPLTHLLFNRIATRLDGLPPRFVNAYVCAATGAGSIKCGCQQGYESLQPQSSQLFACTACEPGFSNGVVAHQGLCTRCTPGRYANKTASDVCQQCEAGTYSTETGAASSSTCKSCEPTTYAPSTGSSECIKCPAGSACPGDKTSKYTPCAVGRYNSFAGQTECTICPSGKYGPRNGSAICLDCPQGTYLNSTGAVTRHACMNCSAGRFGSSDGSSVCLQCPKGHYQDEEGKTACVECRDEGNELMTNAPDFTHCVVQQVLVDHSPSVVEMLFTDNVAYYVSFSVGAVFVALCGMMHYMQHRAGSQPNAEDVDVDEEGHNRGHGSGGGDGDGKLAQLAQLNPFQVLIKAALPGLAFGSEVVLMIGIMPVSPGLGGTMLVFRLVHIVSTLFLCVALFGSESTRKYLSTHGSQALQEAASWSEHFHYDFAKSNIPITGMMLILCAFDISLVQMLPWKSTAFFKESKGFPSKSLMRFALGADMVQASVSALCSIVYIGSAMASNAKSATTSSEAQVFFGLNITLSLLTVTMSFVLLYLRERLLKMTASAAQQGDGGGGVEAGAAGGEEGGGKRRSVEVELGGVYSNHEASLDTPTSFSNPMHTAAMVESLRSTIQDKDERLVEREAQLAEKDEQLAEKDEQLAEKDEQLAENTEEIKMLRRRVKALDARRTDEEPTAQPRAGDPASVDMIPSGERSL